ncbi:MAG: type 1 glutamine amidotransferase [Rhodobacteraceae bacterium]|nr:type 1 glutamine amidotransferase [Paracoccaceae bacterium]
MHIGILITGHAPDELQPDFGDYDAFFARLLDGYGFSFSAWNVVDNEFPPGIASADGWLITGSKHGAYEDHPWIPPLEQFIRDCYSARRPMVGICFGHQIVAQALGGRVEKFAGGWSVGRTQYDWNGRTLFANAWHQDQVVELPQDAQVLAGNDFCRNAALIYDDRTFSVQPHPEYDAAAFAALIDARGPGLIPDDMLDTARAARDLGDDNRAYADMIASFFKKGSPDG